MNRSTLKTCVLSGVFCCSMAVAGLLQSRSEMPVIHDGIAPRTTVTASQHLDEFKMSNPVLSGLEL